MRGARCVSRRILLFIQDSWTIGKRLTLNFGLRTEQESIPNMMTATEAGEYGVPESFVPIKFDFAQKLAPRFGFSYDVFGDSSLKVFGSCGIFYDVMKLEMAEGSFGGFAWKSQYYTWDVRDYSTFRYPCTNYGTFIEELDWRIPSFDTVQEDLKPMSQVEYVLGAEKQLWENFSFKVRGVYKHLIRTVEDIGYLSDLGEVYFIGNPGSDWVNEQLHAFDSSALACPPAKRDYYAVDFSIEKRYSDNWLGRLDVPAAVPMFNAAETQLFGAAAYTVERYQQEWQVPAFDLEQDTRLVISPSGEVVGCTEVWTLVDPPVHPWIWARVDPLRGTRHRHGHAGLVAHPLAECPQPPPARCAARSACRDASWPCTEHGVVRRLRVQPREDELEDGDRTG